MRQLIGAAVFGSDSVAAAYDESRGVARLTTICWVYRRDIVRWSIASFLPIPYSLSHELVLHVDRDEEHEYSRRLTFPSSRQDIDEAVSELTKRAPWALFGYTREARDAMAAGRWLETTHQIEARRERMCAVRDVAELQDAIRLAGRTAHRAQRRHVFLEKDPGHGVD